MISGVPGVSEAVGMGTADSGGDHDGETISGAQLRNLMAADVAKAGPGRGRIVVSTGAIVELDRTVIVGRRPRASRVSASEVPHLITVPSPLQDISRNHLEIRVEGDHVLAQDLNTTNGTALRRGAEPPVRLHPGDAVLMANGDLLDLGEGVTVVFEDLR